MRKIIFLILFLGLYYSIAQVSVGTANPDPSAIFHLESTSKGLLLPRLSTSERDNNIKSPIDGIVIYNITKNCIEFTGAGFWRNICNNTTDPVATGITSNSGGVGIGTTTPNSNTILDVSSATKGFLLPRGTADVSGSVQGMIYYNTTSNKVRLYTTQWVDAN